MSYYKNRDRIKGKGVRGICGQELGKGHNNLIHMSQFESDGGRMFPLHLDTGRQQSLVAF